MAVLTTAKRNKLPGKSFALSGRRYPVHDKAHARNALARAKQELNAGNLSEAEYRTVVRRANGVLNG